MSAKRLVVTNGMMLKYTVCTAGLLVKIKIIYLLKRAKLKHTVATLKDAT